MNIAETISVNPVSKTLGSLHPEATLRFFNTASAKTDKRKKSETNRLASLFFAYVTPNVRTYGGYMLLFRLLFSALLIVSGSFILSGEIYAPTAIVDPFYIGLGEIIAGGMLALGFMSRIAMTCSTLFFGYLSVMSILGGVFDMSALTACLVSLSFMIMGTGQYSADFLIRKAMVVRSRRREMRLREDRLTYRAYRLQHNM